MIIEDIHANEAHTDMGSIKTITDGKRNIAFAEIHKENIPDFEKMGISIIPVRMTSGDSMNAILYRRSSKENALKLNKIIQKHNGYLSDKTPDEAREIGELLEYSKESIDEYVNNNYGTKTPVHSEKSPDDYNDLDEQSNPEFEKQIETDISSQDLNKKLIRKENDVNIMSVNGEYVRGNGFDEWVDGGHHYVDLNEPKEDQKYAKYIPEDEIWVDDVFIVKPNDIEAIILHEMVERYLMIHYGYSYDDAHVISNKAEVDFRTLIKNGNGLHISKDIYHKYIEKYKFKGDHSKLNENYQFNRMKRLLF